MGQTSCKDSVLCRKCNRKVESCERLNCSNYSAVPHTDANENEAETNLDATTTNVDKEAQTRRVEEERQNEYLGQPEEAGGTADAASVDIELGAQGGMDVAGQIVGESSGDVGDRRRQVSGRPVLCSSRQVALRGLLPSLPGFNGHPSRIWRREVLKNMRRNYKPEELKSIMDLDTPLEWYVLQWLSACISHHYESEMDAEDSEENMATGSAEADVDGSEADLDVCEEPRGEDFSAAPGSSTSQSDPASSRSSASMSYYYSQIDTGNIGSRDCIAPSELLPRRDDDPYDTLPFFTSHEIQWLLPRTTSADSDPSEGNSTSPSDVQPSMLEMPSAKATSILALDQDGRFQDFTEIPKRDLKDFSFPEGSTIRNVLQTFRSVYPVELQWSLIIANTILVTENLFCGPNSCAELVDLLCPLRGGRAADLKLSVRKRLRSDIAFSLNQEYTVATNINTVTYTISEGFVGVIVWLSDYALADELSD